MSEITFKSIAIIDGPGEFIDGATVLAMLDAGVTEFVEGVEDIAEAAPVATVASAAPMFNNG